MQERKILDVETHALEGLKQPAEIAVDRWGIPHISAKSLFDLFGRRILPIVRLIQISLVDDGAANSHQPCDQLRMLGSQNVRSHGGGTEADDDHGLPSLVGNDGGKVVGE